MTLIFICFVSELFTPFLSSAILLTSESSKVNELFLSRALGLIQECGFLAELGGCCLKAMPESVLTYQKESSSQSRPLLLMLNGDYAAEMPGSGINAGDTEGQCPQACHLSAGCTLLSGVAGIVWTSRRPEQHLAWNPLYTLANHRFCLLGPVENCKNFHGFPCF